MHGGRLTLAVACLAAVCALMPVLAAAQGQPAPSGAVVRSGGVSPNEPATPVRLPNTGGGPSDETAPVWPVAAAFGVLAAGAYAFRHLRQRRTER